MNPRFAYSTHQSMALAAVALEDYFASGEVCEAEHPQIVRRVLRTPGIIPQAQRGAILHRNRRIGDKMNATQYRAILAALGLTQQEAADLLGRQIRAAHGYANDMPIPTTVARLLVHIAEQKLGKAEFKKLRLSAKDAPRS